MEKKCPRCDGAIGDRAFPSVFRKLTYCSVECYRLDNPRDDVKRWPMSGGRPSRRRGAAPMRVPRLPHR